MANGTTSSPSGEGSRELLEAATPDLYRNNAFRILGLSVDASPREISKRQNEFEHAGSVGRPCPAAYSCLPLVPAPDDEVVRKAVHRLRDPVLRFVDEVFWLWPQQAEKEAREPGGTLGPANLAETVRLWEMQSAKNDPIALHNLAVVHHALALDGECFPPSAMQTEEPGDAQDARWHQAYAYWKALLEHPRFRPLLLSRAKVHADPRLSDGKVDQMWDALPTGLVAIGVRLAVGGAKKKNGSRQEVLRHIGYIRASGLSLDLARRLVVKEAEPFFERVKVKCGPAKNQAGQAPAGAAQVAEELVRTTSADLMALDLLLPRHHLKDIAHDTLADTIEVCARTFAEQTHDWPSTLRLLHMAKDLARGEQVRARLAEAVKIVEGTVQEAQIAGSIKRASELVGRANDAGKRGDSAEVERCLESAYRVCRDPKYGEQIKGWLAECQAASQRTAPSISPMGCLVAVVILALLLVLGQVSESCSKGSSVRTPSSPRPAIPPPYNKPGPFAAPAAPPSPPQLPARPAFPPDYSVPPESFGRYTPSANPLRELLLSQIETAKRKLREMKSALEEHTAELDSLNDRMTRLKATIEDGERRLRLGLAVDVRSHKETVDGYNALVHQFNTRLEQHKADFEEYQRELNATNALIDQYNAAR
jgi:hypothetical protein